MATGPEHYREAERCLRRSEETEPQGADLLVKQAQAHATLALAAATAEPIVRSGHPDNDIAAAWHEVTS